MPPAQPGGVRRAHRSHSPAPAEEGRRTGAPGPRGAATGGRAGGRHPATSRPHRICAAGHPRVRSALGCAETENRMPTNGSLGKHFYFQLAGEKLLICCRWTRLTSQSAECQGRERSRFTLGRRAGLCKEGQGSGPRNQIAGHGAEWLTQTRIVCRASSRGPAAHSSRGGGRGKGPSVGGSAGRGPLSGQGLGRTGAAGAG